MKSETHMSQKIFLPKNIDFLTSSGNIWGFSMKMQKKLSMKMQKKSFLE